MLALQNVFGQGVGISETSITPHASAILELRSTERGFLIPRMTEGERDLIPVDPAANGLMIYNTTTDKLNIYDASNTTWRVLFSGDVGINDIFGTADRITIDKIADPYNPIIDIANTYVGQASISTLGTISTGTWNASTIEVPYGGTGYDSYTDGQLLIGNTATGSLSRSTLTGTINQIDVTNGNGSITLFTPQDIHTGATPEFVSVYLSNLAANSGVYTDGSSVLTTDRPTTGNLGFWNRTGTTLSPATNGDDITTTGDIYTTGTGTMTSAGLLTAEDGLNVTNTLQADDNVIIGATNADVLTVNAIATFNDALTIADGATQTNINNDDINIGNAATDAIGITGITNISGGNLTVDAPVTNINSGVTNLGTDKTDDISLNAEIQGTNPFILEGFTDDDFETTISLIDPTQDNTITLPDKSGTVVLSQAGSLDNNLAVHTDGSGQLVTAVDGQNFNVNSEVINLGNDGTEQITAAGNIDANNGLDVTGAAITTNQAITQTGVNQVIFGGNVDATGGLNVTGADLTTNQSITQTGTNQVTFGGNVDAQNGLDVTGGNLNVTTSADITGTLNADGAATLNDAVTLGDAEADAITISGTVQEGALITGQNALVFDGTTVDANRTTFSFVDPTDVRTINFPDRSGTVVLSGAGTLESDLAVHTDATGQLVTAVDGQNFNVNSEVINLGNDGTEQITAAGNIDANNGLDVTGAAITTNQAITQTGVNQVTFGGNVDATGGLDVTGADLTTNQSITQTGTNQVTFGGNVDAQNGLDVTGADLTINDGISDVFTVAEATGNTAITGTLDVTEGTTVGDLTSTGTVDLGTDAIQAVEIEAGAVTTSEILNATIATEDIADDAVTAAKINVDVAGAGITQNATTGALEADLTTIGGDGISDLDSDGALDLDINGLTNTIAAVADDDLLAVYDADGTLVGKMTRANFIQSAPITNIDVDGGAIDGATIGANNAAAGSFTTVDATTSVSTAALTANGAVDLGTDAIQAIEIEAGAVTTSEILNATIATEDIADDAVTAAKINVDVAGAGITQNATTGALEADLTTIGGEGISDLGSDGDLDLDINGLTNTVAAVADDDLLAVYDADGTLVGKMTRANFIQSAPITNIDVDGGAIDGATIGANNAAAGSFTTVDATTSVSTAALTANGAVDLGTDAIQAIEIEAGAVTTSEILNATIATEDIADDAVTAAKINVDVAGAGITQNATTGALEADLTTIGGDGISDLDSDGALDLDINGLTNTIAAVADDDLLAVYDADGTLVGKMTRANFIQSAPITNIDVDGGAVDGAVIGANNAVAGSFTTVNASTSVTTLDLTATGAVALGNNAIQTAEIQDNQVTIAKIANDAADQILTTDATGNPQWEDKINFASSSLTSANIFVGNASNVATGVVMSGDVAIDNTGTTTIQQGAVEATAIEGLTDGQFIIGVDGTAANNSKATMSGDVAMTNLGVTTVETVGGSTAANIATAEALANAATNANTANTIVRRDGSGDFSAGTITANLTGNATNVTGTVAIANGGTGQTTQQTAINALAASVADGQFLRGDGTNVSMSAIQASDVPTLNQNTTGNAATATTLETARNINGVAFDGTADITVTADAGTLTGNTLNATVVNSSLTSVGTLTDLTVTNPIAGSVTGNAANVTGTVAIANGGTGQTTQQAAINALAASVADGQFLRGNGTNVSMSAIQVSDVPVLNQNTTGNAATATALETARNINGVAFDGTADITVTADAGTLTGNTLNATVVNSSLTSVGTLTDLTVTNPIAGSVTGTATNVTGTVAIANGGTGASNATNARTNLGLEIGTNVQAYDANLDDISSLAADDGNIIVGNGTNFIAESGATARTSLGAAASGANTDITSVLLNQTGLVVKGGDDNALTITPNETLTADRTLNIETGDADRTLTLDGDATISGTNTGDQTAIVGIEGTLAEFNAALTDDNFVSLTGTETLTNKSLTSPTINGGTIDGATINSTPIGSTTPSTGAFTTLSANSTVDLGSASIQTGEIENGTILNEDVNASAAIDGTKISPDFGSQNVTTSGSILSSGSGGIGYATGSGAGGTVTQSTNKSTAVTINNISGQITTSNSTLDYQSSVEFRVNNSTVSASDVIILNIAGGTDYYYEMYVSEVGSGYFDITLINYSTFDLSESIDINFAVIKATQD